MKNILVPSDFSACAANALRYALEIASRSGKAIITLNVTFPTDGVNNSTYDAFWIDDYLAQRKKDLKEWTDKIKAESGHTVPVSSECRIGFPAATIRDAADDLHVALVVMGTTGATGLKGVFLGSTAGSVIANSQMPVLTIPPEAVFSRHANFVLTTDFNLKVNNRSRHAMEMVLDAHEASLRVLHVIGPDEEPPTSKEPEVSKFLDGINHYFHYIHDTDIPNAVDNFVESTNAGGVIAVAHHHNLLYQLFHRSVSRALAGRLQVPMLAMSE